MPSGIHAGQAAEDFTSPMRCQPTTSVFPAQAGIQVRGAETHATPVIPRRKSQPTTLPSSPKMSFRAHISVILSEVEESKPSIHNPRLRKRPPSVIPNPDRGAQRAGLRPTRPLSIIRSTTLIAK